ncbi:MAG TPA: class I SAM-dependent methyltransferase [Hypericibacter adhaerens]|jgi:SAM-dependent methyltransferase|uniref:class I SAM-dependent methyltransferase n=1 Tax=Hypericibacter adhaerens TaxID=2602016 RepID=UPI002BDF23ED|nr:class I SAM-dependent methyltransferase [Hypericibacter adhaerens]HWA41663.1 class I SAM-dependent methyltransferase [Hypericibacter adhaerens]
MKRDDYTAANREAWNEAAPIHERRTFERLLEGFRQPGYSCLEPIETETLLGIGVAGKAVTQICCNNGRELLSVKTMGAGRCVGFDISEEFIAQGRQLAEAGGIEAEFLATDVYRIPAAYDAQFDLALITIGALGWMPDLKGFFAIVARLLKPKGQLFIHEQHPIMGMFEPGDPEPQPQLRHSYFKADPFRDETGLDYWGKETYKAKPTYWFQHKLSDVITGCLENGLALELFTEHEQDLGGIFDNVTAQPILPPLSYRLIARKAP